METASGTYQGSKGSCAACDKTLAMDDEEWWAASCGHNFCWTCIEALLRSSLHGGPFPPKCCYQEISIYEDERVRSVLYEKLVEKREELRSSDRTYCSVSTCSSFIGPSRISEINATCPVCGGITCVACKATSHPGECPDRPADEQLQQLFDTAASEGWRRCGRCKSMIERVEGCPDMM